jgi:hypothetical protein
MYWPASGPTEAAIFMRTAEQGVQFCVAGRQERRWPVMTEGRFNVLVAVDLEEALHELGRANDTEKRRQEAHAAGKTNLSAIDKNCRRDRSLAKGVNQGCNLLSTISGPSV